MREHGTVVAEFALNKVQTIIKCDRTERAGHAPTRSFFTIISGFLTVSRVTQQKTLPSIYEVNTRDAAIECVRTKKEKRGACV